MLESNNSDSNHLPSLGFTGICRGYHPEATAKTDPGETDISVQVGGVVVEPSDILVGDDDGVVVIPATIASQVLASVGAVAQREEMIRARILAGETTYEIFDLGRI